MKDQPHHDFLALQNLRLSLSVYTINTLASKHCIFSVTKKNATNFWMSVSEKKIIIMLYKVFVFWELEFFHQKYCKMYKNWILISGKKTHKKYTYYLSRVQQCELFQSLNGTRYICTLTTHSMAFLLKTLRLLYSSFFFYIILHRLYMQCS